MASPDRPGSVSLTIGELVLHGFRRGDRYAIADAAQAELSRALSEAVVSGSLPAHLVRSSRRSELDAGSFAVRAGAPAGVIGAEIGRALLRESVR